MFSHHMVVAGNLHQPVAFEHVVDLLLDAMLVPADVGHRLIHRNPVIEVTRARRFRITSGFDSAPPK